VEALLPFALILVAFYFLILRPQRARAKQAEQLQARMAPGAEIMTTSGIYGTVLELRDDSIVLEVAPGSTLRISKAAVGRVLTDDVSTTDDASTTDASTTDDDADPAAGADPVEGTDADAASRRGLSAE
jgi:preprotein translocase subunit YajC